MHQIETSLMGIHRSFIGGYRSRGWRNNNAPQIRQGEREISRRLRQEVRKLMKDQNIWNDMIAEGAYHKFRSASSAQLLEIRASLL